ncbi:MAG TPA: TetR/AcrR family transcriptional regulator [Pseudonocardiaceae bacterium]|nr:TetR/AcrR family transcriptional regulator [Pseudonocardiaceae bacterium]
MAEQTRRGRGRRPAAQVRAEVLAAAGELLLDVGMGAFTFERVAALSGASKVTLYKWWPSKGALALEAYFHAVQQHLEFPDTGDIEADLTAQVRSFIGLLAGRPGAVIRELIGHAQTDPELLNSFRERYSRPRRDLAIAAMRRARERGQIRADVDLEVIVDQLWGAGYHRLLLPDEPLTEQFATALVRNVMAGVGMRHTAASREG